MGTFFGVKTHTVRSEQLSVSAAIWIHCLQPQITVVVLSFSLSHLRGWARHS